MCCVEEKRSPSPGNKRPGEDAQESARNEAKEDAIEVNGVECNGMAIAESREAIRKCGGMSSGAPLGFREQAPASSRGGSVGVCPTVAWQNPAATGVENKVLSLLHTVLHWMWFLCVFFFSLFICRFNDIIGNHKPLTQHISFAQHFSICLLNMLECTKCTVNMSTMFTNAFRAFNNAFGEFGNVSRIHSQCGGTVLF